MPFEILETIKTLLVVDKKATRQTIKQMLPHKNIQEVTKVLFDNDPWLVRNKAGAITGLKGIYLALLVEAGQKFWKLDQFDNYGYKGDDYIYLYGKTSQQDTKDLIAKKHSGMTMGGLGDSYYSKGIHPDLVAEVEALGYRPISEAKLKLTDYWKE